MAEEFRQFLESKGLTKNTMDALKEIGVVGKGSLLHVTDDDVDQLPLDPKAAKIQKAALRQVIHEMKTTPEKGTFVVSGVHLKAKTVEQGAHFGALCADGGNAKNVGARVSDVKHEVEEAVKGKAVVMDLTAGKDQ